MQPHDQSSKVVLDYRGKARSDTPLIQPVKQVAIIVSLTFGVVILILIFVEAYGMH